MVMTLRNCLLRLREREKAQERERGREREREREREKAQERKSYFDGRRLFLHEITGVEICTFIVRVYRFH